MPAASIRPLHGGDDEIVRWIVHQAITWEDPLDGPAESSLLSDPLIVRYHAGWGRGGDFGVAAEVGDRVVGAAFARLLTPDAPGFGFVDRDTPELGIAVDRAHRRHAVGTRLLAQLASAATDHGYRRLSLSVSRRNPACAFYRRLGYRTVRSDDDALVMVREL